jgi:hypothetical protein
MVKVCDCFPELKQTTEAREGATAHPERPAPEGPQSSSRSVTSIGSSTSWSNARKAP